MASASPYLNFAGNCLEAFEFYQSVLGGEFSANVKFSDMPPGASPGDPDETHEAAPDGIMHISLPIGDSVLMGSDVPPGSGDVTFGSSCYVFLNPDSPDEAQRIFDGLSAGGDIELPFGKQFWGDYFGSFIDRYGIRWMVDVGAPESESESESKQPTG